MQPKKPRVTVYDNPEYLKLILEYRADLVALPIGGYVRNDHGVYWRKIDPAAIPELTEGERQLPWFEAINLLGEVATLEVEGKTMPIRCAFTETNDYTVLKRRPRFPRSR